MRYFTSDPHFFHTNIIHHCDRPFADAGEMNQAIIDTWNDTVTDDDEVWLLGDLSMGKVADIISDLPGTKILIAGNHDACWKKGRLKETATQRYLDAGFSRIETFAKTTVARWEVNVSHFPYEGDSHHEDRYSEVRPKRDGRWLLHGHVHDIWRVNGSQINCGLDAWGGRFVTDEDIVEIMSNGTNQQLPAIRWT